MVGKCSPVGVYGACRLCVAKSSRRTLGERIRTLLKHITLCCYIVVLLQRPCCGIQLSRLAKMFVANIVMRSENGRVLLKISCSTSVSFNGESAEYVGTFCVLLTLLSAE